jgi:hypothetical protein
MILTMRAIGTENDWDSIRITKRGYVYNDMVPSGNGPSAAKYNVLHAASCRWLKRMNLRVPKYAADELVVAVAWLETERGAEGASWKRCVACLGGSAGPAGEPRSAATSPDPAATTRLASVSPERATTSPSAAWSVTVAADVVVAVSPRRLQFQPRGDMKLWRDELRTAIGTIDVGDSRLVCEYHGPADGYDFDVENVCLYNVGGSALGTRTRRGVLIERTVTASGPHRLVYRGEGGGESGHWSAGETLATITDAQIPAIQDGSGMVSRVWWALRTQPIDVFAFSPGEEALVLELLVQRPADGATASAIVKNLVDGLICRMHFHDDLATLDASAALIAGHIRQTPAAAAAALTARDGAVLGGHPLFRPTNNQWLNADHRLVRIDLSLVDAARWTINASLSLARAVNH